MSAPKIDLSYLFEHQNQMLAHNHSIIRVIQLNQEQMMSQLDQITQDLKDTQTNLDETKSDIGRILEINNQQLADITQLQVTIDALKAGAGSIDDVVAQAEAVKANSRAIADLIPPAA